MQDIFHHWVRLQAAAPWSSEMQNTAYLKELRKAPEQVPNTLEFSEADLLPQDNSEHLRSLSSKQRTVCTWSRGPANLECWTSDCPSSWHKREARLCNELQIKHFVAFIEERLFPYLLAQRLILIQINNLSQSLLVEILQVFVTRNFLPHRCRVYYITS